MTISIKLVAVVDTSEELQVSLGKMALNESPANEDTKPPIECISLIRGEKIFLIIRAKVSTPFEVSSMRDWVS